MVMAAGATDVAVLRMKERSAAFCENNGALAIGRKTTNAPMHL
jgi:hypothetical protein